MRNQDKLASVQVLSRELELLQTYPGEDHDDKAGRLQVSRGQWRIWNTTICAA
jgi:hypothetical protein